MKKSYLSIIFLLSIIMMAGMVYGGIVVTPASSGKMSGSTFLVNVSFGSLPADLNTDVINCSVTYASGTQFNTSVALATNQVNTSGRDFVNFTTNTYNLRDTGTTVTLTTTCYNSTQTITNSSTSVYVDNMIPSCVWTTPSTGSQTIKTGQTWSGNSKNATSCTIHFDANTFTGGVSTSDVCSYSAVKGVPAQKLYSTLTMTVNDGTNASTCSLSTITIDDGGNNLVAKKNYLDSIGKGSVFTGKTESNNNLLIAGIIVIGIILLINKKK